jgi:hypothetical protein
MALKSVSIDAGRCKQLADSLAAAPGVAAAAAEAARREAAAKARWADLLGRMQWSRAHVLDYDSRHEERLVATMAELATADLADRERHDVARDTLLRWIAEDRLTDAPDDDYRKQYPTVSDAAILARVRLAADRSAWVTQSRPSDFQEWLRETLRHDLENELNAWRDTLSARAAVRAAARAAAERVAAVPAEVAFASRLASRRAADSAAQRIAAKGAAADSGRAIVDAERLRRYATAAGEQLGNLHVSSITPLPASERGALIVRALNRAKTWAAAEGIEFDPATAPPPQEARAMVVEARTALTSIHRWDLDGALAKGCTVAQPTGCTPLAQWLVQNYRPFQMGQLARRFGGFACRQGHDFDLCTRVAANREGERTRGDKASLAQAFGEWVLSCAVESTLLRPNYSVCTRVTEYLNGSDADLGAPDVEMALGFLRLACAHTTQSCGEQEQEWKSFEFYIRGRANQ